MYKKQRKTYFKLHVGWENIKSNIINVRDTMEPLRAQTCESNMFQEQLEQPSYPPRKSAFLQTLCYLYDYCRCGVYVRIQNHQVVMFTPFVNPEFQNNWASQLQFMVDGELCTMDAYFDAKHETHGVRENMIMPHQWWSNAYILCNVMPPDIWGDFMLKEYHGYFVQLAPHVADVEFFLNKRDFPQIRKDKTAPYEFLYQTKNTTVCVKQHLPIMSGYVTNEYADIAFPTPADLKIACNPPVVRLDKKPIALFRGSNTNVKRLELARMSQLWEKDELKRGLMDVKLTNWSARDKVTTNGIISLSTIKDMDVGKHHYMPEQQQLEYKYCRLYRSKPS